MLNCWVVLVRFVAERSNFYDFRGAMIGSFLLLPLIIFSRLDGKRQRMKKSVGGKRYPLVHFWQLPLFWLGARHWMEVWFFGKLSPVANFLGV